MGLFCCFSDHQTQNCRRLEGTEKLRGAILSGYLEKLENCETPEEVLTALAGAADVTTRLCAGGLPRDALGPAWHAHGQAVRTLLQPLAARLTSGDCLLQLPRELARQEGFAVRTLRVLVDTTYSCALAELRRTLARLLDVLDAIDQAGAPSGPLDLQWAGPLNHIFSSIKLAVDEQVVLETPASASGKLSSYLGALECIGIRQSHLPLCLWPSHKKVLVHLAQCASSVEAEEKLSCCVTREGAFWELMQQRQEQGLLRGSEELSDRGPGDHQESCRRWTKMFPKFRSSSGPLQADMVEGGEGHGPRKELFLCVGSGIIQAVDAQHPALFTFHRGSSSYWFNPRLAPLTADLRETYFMVGWAIAQTFANRAVLGVPLNPLLFRMILHQGDLQADMQTVHQFDPNAAEAIRKVRKMPEAEFKSILSLEGLPPGTTRTQYEDHALQHVLMLDLEDAGRQLSHGFWSVVDRQLLQQWKVSEWDLYEMVVGPLATPAEVPIQDIFHVVVEDINEEAKLVVEALWKLIGRWQEDMRRAFLKFVTGTDRFPLPLTEVLHIQFPFLALTLKQHEELLQRLPQSHTCDNILELPNYLESLMVVGDLGPLPNMDPLMQDTLVTQLEQHLETKLLLAVTECHSYALDEVDSQQEEDLAGQRLQSGPLGANGATRPQDKGPSALRPTVDGDVLASSTSLLPRPFVCAEDLLEDERSEILLLDVQPNVQRVERMSVDGSVTCSTWAQDSRDQWDESLQDPGLASIPAPPHSLGTRLLALVDDVLEDVSPSYVHASKSPRTSLGSTPRRAHASCTGSMSVEHTSHEKVSGGPSLYHQDPLLQPLQGHSSHIELDDSFCTDELPAIPSFTQYRMREMGPQETRQGPEGLPDEATPTPICETPQRAASAAPRIQKSLTLEPFPRLSPVRIPPEIADLGPGGWDGMQGPVLHDNLDEVYLETLRPPGY